MCLLLFLGVRGLPTERHAGSTTSALQLLRATGVDGMTPGRHFLVASQRPGNGRRPPSGSHPLLSSFPRAMHA